MSELQILIKRYNTKTYNNSKRWDKYIWFFTLENWVLHLNRGIPTKRWLLWDMWITVPITTELYNFLYNYK